MLVGRPDDALNKGVPYTTIRRILNPHAGVTVVGTGITTSFTTGGGP